jgi:uncharacterized protein
MPRTLVGCPYFRRAFGWSVPIGGLAGLIGLGGGEFRLPVLMHSVGFDAKSAVPLNLMVSAVTVGFAIVSRSWSISPTSIIPYLPEVIGLALGGIMSASYGTRLVNALNTERLVQIIACLLALIGCLLIVDAVAPFEHAHLLPANPAIHFSLGVAFGVGIGLVSSILGVAGGELLIPTLLFVFGTDIRTAGSASLLISVGLVVAGLWHYWRMGRGVQRITAAMSAGSILGAIIGALALAYAPVEGLKLLLGAVLIGAAAKTIASRR